MKMCVESIVYDEGMFYFVPKDINILFSCSVSDEQIEILDVVPEEDGNIERQFNGLCKVNNKIVLIPYTARKIWSYDLTTRTWTSIDISEYVPEDAEAKFAGGFHYLDKLYLFGHEYNGILCLDINTYEIKSIYQKDGLYLWGQKIGIYERRAYIAMSHDNKVVEFNFETNKINFIDLNIAAEGLASVGYDGVGMIILPSSGNSYYVMNIDTSVENRQLPQELSTSIYNGLAISNKFIYGYSSWGKSFLLNRESNEVRIIHSNTYYADYKEELGFIEIHKGVLNIYDNEFVIKKTIPLEISDKELELYYSRYSLTSRVYEEREAFNLSQFLREM